MSSYSEQAHASVSLHIMEDVPIKAHASRNNTVPTLIIDAGGSSINLFFWGPEVQSKITKIRDACDAMLAIKVTITAE